MHNGADFTDAQRLERTQDVGILAIADGMVVEVINGALVGWTVAVAHEGRILSRYQHMKNGSVRVKTGDKIKKGDTIGVMGTTGRSTAIHLHLGIQENWSSGLNGWWVDPLPYLRGEKTIVGATSDKTPAAAAAPSLQKRAGETEFKPGDKVRVKSVAVGEWAATYAGGTFRVWHEIYDVMQVAGDRIVIGVNGAVAAPVNADILVKI
jgi:hypothetical protein